MPYGDINNRIGDALERLKGSLEIRPFQLVIDIWRVSADTKTCGSPLNPAPAGALRLPAGKRAGILTYFRPKLKEKRQKDWLQGISGFVNRWWWGGELGKEKGGEKCERREIFFENGRKGSVTR